MHPDEGMVDRYSRLILALVFIGLAVFRLIRYVQIGTGRRRISAVPSTSVNQSAPAGADLIPNPPRAAPSGFARRGLGSLAAVVSWVAGNALLWTALFGLQYLDGVPVFWRLFADVFANLYLIRLSRRIAERVTTNIDSSRSSRNPFD